MFDNYIDYCNSLEAMDSKMKGQVLKWPLEKKGEEPFYWACGVGDDWLATVLVSHGCGADKIPENNAFDYWLALARNDVPGAEGELLKFPRQIILRCIDEESPFHHKDLQIVMHYLIGQHFQAGDDDDISIRNIKPGCPKTPSEIRRTRETILLFALSIDDKDMIARYIDVLIQGSHNGLQSNFVELFQISPKVASVAINKLIVEIKELKLENGELKQQALTQGNEQTEILHLANRQGSNSKAQTKESLGARTRSFSL